MFMTMLQHILLPMKLGEETPEDQGQPGRQRGAQATTTLQKRAIVALNIAS